MLQKLIHNIFSVLFPEKCLRCGDGNAPICSACLARIDYPDLIERDNIFAAANYGDPVPRSAVWKLKYKNMRGMAKPLGELLYERLFKDKVAEVVGRREIFLIPVPLSKVRLRERGFNQSELIAKHLLETILKNNPVWEGKIVLRKDILLKTRHTESQVSLKERSERLRNLKDSMAVVSPDSLQNKDVILIDDVSTTGATIEEARRVLRYAGARKVI